MISYPIEQIPDQGKTQRNKSLWLKRELYWIKTLGTQFPYRMNHNFFRKRDIFITFPFSNNARKILNHQEHLYKVENNEFQFIQWCVNVLLQMKQNLDDYLVSVKSK